LVVSRDQNIRSLLAPWAAPHIGCRTVFVDDVEVAVRRYMVERPDIVALDLATPENLSGLERFRRIDADVPIVAVEVHGSTTRVVQAMKLGAADVVTASCHPRDVEAVLAGALAERRARRAAADLQREVEAQSRHMMLFGSGHAMAEVRQLIDRIADTDVPVLIRGESGTGKELVARALAAPSLHRGMPFVKVNCAALPPELFEAELFGYERGAFTGAERAKPGKFEIAHGGSIFLDEVAELPSALQSKLLHVVQDGQFSRVGGHADIRAVVRVIAATNRDVHREVIEGRFRQDLLFRLNVIPLYVPPLRERRSDIPLLVDFFLKRWSVFYKRRYAAISSELMDACVRHSWPGNVRELENLIKRTVVLGSETAARNALLAGRRRRPRVAPSAPAVEAPAPAPAAIAGLATNVDRHSLKHVSRRAAAQAEAALISRVLAQTHGNQKQAAVSLGISYKALLYKAKAHGLGTAGAKKAERPRRSA
jgi:two-component system, NtrC family, response regulator AtoC